MLERQGKKPRPASMPAVLWTKRYRRDNERSSNAANTFCLGVPLRTVQFFIFFSRVEGEQFDQAIHQLMACIPKQIASFSSFSYRVFRSLRLFAPLTLSLSIERTWRMK